MLPKRDSIPFSGALGRTGANSTLTTNNADRFLLMLDLLSTGVFSLNGVLAATQHFAGLNTGNSIAVIGFVQSDDIDGTGNMQDVLHFQKDVSQ